MHVHTVPVDQANGDVRRIYDSDLREDGYVANMTQLFSLNPAAYDAWGQLTRAIRGQMDFRRYELATIAAARALRCRYCVSAHGGRMLDAKLFDRQQVEAITRDFHNASLDTVDVAIMELAEKVALHAYRVTPDDIDRLRQFGLNDAEIFNVVLAAAARCFFSKTLDAMDAEPDEALAATNDLIQLVELRPPES
ncbi:MAG TPA: carboxymuconolactone decarboxylase family protein [Candidatus Limnocylindrales bacterium]|nr:carboxymuconolactone decarboxylase family protein [Candidatus Limnocylindrales bacterium]